MKKLTVKEIEKSKAKDRPYKITVDEGLQMRIAVDGDKTWLVRYVISGTERQYRLPKSYGDGNGFYSLLEAREESRNIRALAREGIDYQGRLENERLAEVKQKADEAAAAIAKAQVEAQRIKQAESENKTFQHLFDYWLTDGVRRQDGNAELKRSFGANCLPALGHIPIKDLTEHHLRGVLRALVARGVNRAACVMHENITQMLKWAEKRQPYRKLLAEGNPSELIEISKIVAPDYDMENIRKRVLSPDEIRELRDIFLRMQEQFDNAPDRRSAIHPFSRAGQCALWIMLSTLCRIGETLMGRWDHVDFEARQWFIPRENVKGKISANMIFLSDFSLAQFRQLHTLTGHSEWLLPAAMKDGHVCLKSLSKQVGDRQAMFKLDQAGNPLPPMKNRRSDNTLVLSGGSKGNWTPHDMRRTGATVMQSLKIPDGVINRCQNHVIDGSKSDGGSRVDGHYLHHPFDDEKREAWRRLGERLQLILNPSDNVVLLRSA